MSNKPWRLMIRILAVFAALVIGLLAGYKVGFAIRDYQAAKETIARDSGLEAVNDELQELRLRLALVNADLVWMVKRAENQLGLEPRPSEGD